MWCARTEGLARIGDLFKRMVQAVTIHPSYNRTGFQTMQRIKYPRRPNSDTRQKTQNPFDVTYPIDPLRPVICRPNFAGIRTSADYRGSSHGLRERTCDQDDREDYSGTGEHRRSVTLTGGKFRCRVD